MNDTLAQAFLEDALLQFKKYKAMAEKAVDQTSDADLFRLIDEDANSMAIVMKHMAGNMRSRWTDFLTADGEKPDRHRDTEFEMAPTTSRDEVMAVWEAGWQCVFEALDPLTPPDVLRTVTIRGEPHTVLQAVNRQLLHYAYHVGQIVLLARHFKGPAWQSLSIPRGQSETYKVTPFGRL